MFIDYYIDFNTLAHCHYNFFFSKLNFIYMIISNEHDQAI